MCQSKIMNALIDRLGSCIHGFEVLLHVILVLGKGVGQGVLTNGAMIFSVDPPTIES